MSSAEPTKTEGEKQADPDSDLRTLVPVFISFGTVLLVGGLGLLLDRPYADFVLLGGVILGPVIGAALNRLKADPEKKAERDDSKLYLDGKMQRYSLLFSVNGGAFAIGQLLREGKTTAPLSMPVLAWGAGLFTVIMTADIWLWGADMRHKHGPRVFRPVGQAILLLIGALLLAGWFLVAARSC